MLNLLNFMYRTPAAVLLMINRHVVAISGFLLNDTGGGEKTTLGSTWISIAFLIAFSPDFEGLQSSHGKGGGVPSNRAWAHARVEIAVASTL